MDRETAPSVTASARKKLLDAGVTMIRAKGYEATSIDELCAEAGVAKGSFFHHFKNKQAFGVATAEHFAERSKAFFAAAPYQGLADPVDRLLGYVDFFKSLLTDDFGRFTCLHGTMVQEVYLTEPEIRAACDAGITSSAARLEADIAEAIAEHGIRADWTAESLAHHIQTVVQGAFILAKAKGNASIVAASIDHLRRYIEYVLLVW